MSPVKQIKIKEETKGKNLSSRVLIPKEKEWFKSEGQLAIDVYETSSNFVVMTAIAGVTSKNLEVLVEKDMLIIKGNRQDPEDSSEKKNYFYQECYWGPFSRKILLPENVDSSRIEAEMDKGILIIKIPKIQKEERKKVGIKE